MEHDRVRSCPYFRRTVLGSLKWREHHYKGTIIAIPPEEYRYVTQADLNPTTQSPEAMTPTASFVSKPSLPSDPVMPHLRRAAASATPSRRMVSNGLYPQRSTAPRTNASGCSRAQTPRPDDVLPRPAIDHVSGVAPADVTRPGVTALVMPSGETLSHAHRVVSRRQRPPSSLLFPSGWFCS